MRPTRPEHARSIGFPDSLWDFVQRCWDPDMKLRPEAVEVTVQLREAAANWDSLMPPCDRADNVAPDSEESTSGSLEHCESEILLLP